MVIYLNKTHMRLKVSLLTVFFCFIFSSLSFANDDPKKITIVLDAGHGGHDFGTKNSLYNEKDYTLEIVKAVKERNQNTNIEIVLTRDSDQFLELIERSALINKVNPTYFISVHLNSAMDKTKNGFEVYHYPKNNEAKILAENFIQNVNFPIENRGVKSANFHILRESKAPGFIYEIGFISNENDAAYLTSEDGKEKIISEILKFIQK
ncbi:N-acetylmuramoyl-L-alanine amidase [Faecalibacter macacae]|uniref:N-acetylmuramoyl-L-alanine amidase n=2 Tax=Faecalibacter macacae TaxID=1859289 RepID=A0A3L9ME83_9FLAO|nr:N-acetylmuramoyl-L-alanine amidase [Faecalibacter macacae]